MAQKSTIEGVVSNAEKDFISYANVYLKKTRIGATTDENGHFHIEIPNSIHLPFADTILVSYVGYEKYYLPIYVQKGTKKIEMELQPTVLKEVIVKSLPDFSADKIVKLALRNKKKNYSNSASFTKGFYREVIKENGKNIELNEAVLNIKYDKYNDSKNVIKDGFKAFYLKRKTLNSSFTPFYHLIWIPSYVHPINDQVKIISSRRSLNLSKYKIDASPVGGPTDLLALDKLKYGYDFLDKSMLKKYNYSKRGLEVKNGEKCYVIEFTPRSSEIKSFHQTLNKKMKYAVYQGLLYIAVNNYTVVHFKYQFVNYFPIEKYGWDNLHVIVDVDYQKYEEKWRLNKVTVHQDKIQQLKNTAVLYECNRNLEFLEEIKNPNKITQNEDSIFYITYTDKIRNFSHSYDSLFWRNYEKNESYKSVSEVVLQDLESTGYSLEKQFQSLNIPINKIEQPVAKKKITQRVYHKDTLIDNYQWMKDVEEEDFVDYLKLENQYFEEVSFKLEKEAKAFILKYNNLFDVSDNSKQMIYRIDDRRIVFEQNSNGNNCVYVFNKDSTKTFLFNMDSIKKGKTNFKLSKISFSPNGKFYSYSYSEKGDIVHTVNIFKVRSDSLIGTLKNKYYHTWINDSILLYLAYNEIKEGKMIKSYNINNNQHDLVYSVKPEEANQLELYKSNSNEYVIINNGNESSFFLKMNSLHIHHFNFLDKYDRVYNVNHWKGEYFYCIAEKKSKFYVLQLSPSDEKEVIIYESDKPILDLELRNHFLAVNEYNIIANQLKIINLHTKKERLISFRENFYDVSFNLNDVPKDSSIIIEYSSPIEPYIKYEVNVFSGEKKILEKRKLVPNLSKEFEKSYKITLDYAVNNGVKIPITLFYNEKTIENGVKGVFLQAYGAYGISISPDFSSRNKTLVDLGYVYAFAHVRGGGELGNQWYEDGILLNKKNTFEDYISSAKYLKQKFSLSASQMTGYGISAGGMIMGYAATKHPDLFGTLIFDHPYLDVLNTMLTPSRSQTIGEYEEVGNPEDTTYYKYIKSYSTYQNIKKQDYPNLLFLGGYYDVQTPIYQIANCVAKFRENNTSKSLILFHTDFKSGHAGNVNIVNYGKQLSLQYGLMQYDTIISKDKK